MLLDELYKLSHNRGNAGNFPKILYEIYSDNDISKYRNELEVLGIIERNDLTLYGKNYPLFKSLRYFNEVPIFRTESQYIVFLKKNGFNPSSTLISLNHDEKRKLGSLIIEKMIAKVPREYVPYLSKLIFGKCYYLKKHNIEVREYLSKLNALYKLKKYDEVKRCLSSQELPSEELIKKYQKNLAKSIEDFNKKLNNGNIEKGILYYNDKPFNYQYIFIKRSILSRLRDFILGENTKGYYPAIVNISYSNPNINYMEPFFIFVDGIQIDVFARVPKLLYLKDNLTLNHLNLKGKHTYFGSWNRENFEKFIAVLNKNVYSK
ncbi:hypothetical protein KKP88_00375 [Methanothermococcus sp. SCGC AD-155-K20]|nr:hypothetical protein [Methanothermococcus sp. SCGC AD-155-K20]